MIDLTQGGLDNNIVSNQIGNDNSITATQTGGNRAEFIENGNSNTITADQVVGGQNVSISLNGSGLIMKIKQTK